jgi:hypothetical protein
MTEFRTYQMCGMNMTVRGPFLAAPQSGAAGSAGQQDALFCLPGLTGASPGDIHRRVSILDLYFLQDDSASMADSDPCASRNAAALSLIELLQRYSGRGGARAAVVRWGQTAPAALALGPTSVHAGRLRRALTVQHQLGGTCPAAALARVRKLLPASSGRTAVILLITDGQDLGDGLAWELQHLPPHSVHLILADPSGDCWGHEAEWRALGWGSFTRLDDLGDRQRVALESGSVIARAIGLQLGQPRTRRTGSHRLLARHRPLESR